MGGPVTSSQQVMLGTDAYRKVLANAPNASVNVASIGMVNGGNGWRQWVHVLKRLKNLKILRRSRARTHTHTHTHTYASLFTYLKAGLFTQPSSFVISFLLHSHVFSLLPSPFVLLPSSFSLRPSFFLLPSSFSLCPSSFFLLLADQSGGPLGDEGGPIQPVKRLRPPRRQGQQDRHDGRHVQLRLRGGEHRCGVNTLYL